MWWLPFVKSLSIIFQSCNKSGAFPNSWEKSNIVPTHKKNDKQLINNYRSVSLLPIRSKISERIIFHSIFQFTEENKSVNVNQSGFQPVDSCEYQPLPIVHNKYAGFDQNPPLDVCSCFFHLSRLWIRFDMKQTMGFTCGILTLLQSFLSNRNQRVTVNGQTSDWFLY